MELQDNSQARQALGSVKEQMLLLQHTEELLAQADALSKQYEEWTCHRNLVLMNVRNGHASWQCSLLTEQVWAASQPMISHFEHLLWQRRVHENNQSALQQQRLLRSRLAREREQLARDSEQMLREERFQQRAELSFLERVHAQNQARQADFMKQSHELLAQLQRQREQQCPSTACAAVQTDAMRPAIATPQTTHPQENSNESYGESAFASESEASDYGTDFDDDSQSSNSSLRESCRSRHSSSSLSGSLSGGTRQETSERTHSSSSGGGGGGGAVGTGGGVSAGGDDAGGITPSSNSVSSMISDSQMASANEQSISIGESIKSIGSDSRRSGRKSISSKSNSSMLSESINTNSAS